LSKKPHILPNFQFQHSVMVSSIPTYSAASSLMDEIRTGFLLEVAFDEIYRGRV